MVNNPSNFTELKRLFDAEIGKLPTDSKIQSEAIGLLLIKLMGGLNADLAQNALSAARWNIDRESIIKISSTES